MHKLTAIYTLMTVENEVLEPNVRFSRPYGAQ